MALKGSVKIILGQVVSDTLFVLSDCPNWQQISKKRIVKRRDATCGYDFVDVLEGTSPLNTPQ